MINMCSIPKNITMCSSSSTPTSKKAISISELSRYDLTKARTLKFENVRILRDHVLQQVNLWVEDGKIINPEERFWAKETEETFEADFVIDGMGCTISPGLIDLQINGAFGVDFANPSVTVEQLVDTARKMLQYGVTSFCPTIVSSSREHYATLLPKFAQAIAVAKKRQDVANILGLHLEGPFINKEYKGAHDILTLTEPVNGLSDVFGRYGSDLQNVAIVTMAPELEGALTAIEALKKEGVIVSAGHSMANIEQAQKAVKSGVTMITHLFNAMGPFHHRDPGLIGLIGNTDANERPYYGLILDGIHSHKTSVRIAQHAHPGGLVLVTDAMAGMGLPPGEYYLGELHVDVQEGNKAVLNGTNTIAGSVVSMDSCIRLLKDYTGCSVEQALNAASLHPARVLGLDDRKGTLAFGADADFVLFNDKLEVQQTYLSGKLLFNNNIYKT